MSIEKEDLQLIEDEARWKHVFGHCEDAIIVLARDAAKTGWLDVKNVDHHAKLAAVGSLIIDAIAAGIEAEAEQIRDEPKHQIERAEWLEDR